MLDSHENAHEEPQFFLRKFFFLIRVGCYGQLQITQCVFFAPNHWRFDVNPIHLLFQIFFIQIGPSSERRLSGMLQSSFEPQMTCMSRYLI